MPVAAVFVAGERVPSEFTRVPNPADLSETVGHCAAGTSDHVAAAVEAAKQAFSGWAVTSPAERAAALRAAADRISVELDELATVLTREQGKILSEALRDASGAPSMLRYYAGFAERLAADEVIRSDARSELFVRRRPMGVTAVIVPWNVPVLLAFAGIAPALIAGNTVVVKPSDFAPLALSRIVEVLAGTLPVGVVNLVPGGSDAGAALAQHPAVRKIFFTGSTETGGKIMRDAASTIKSLSLELGGNDPAIVLSSSQLSEELFAKLVTAVYRNSGQVCLCVKRIYVHESLLSDFVIGFTRAADRLVVGNGLDPRTVLGPVNNKPQYDRVQALIAGARAAGARVESVGTMSDPDMLDRGWFVMPTVVTEISADADLVTGEQFGPVVPILGFSSDAEVTSLANDTEFGLSASVWSDDRDHARRVADTLEAGTVFINAHSRAVTDQSMPFGGFKRSGIGRNRGFYGIEECTELQSVAHVFAS